jgi:hypothetical protein
VTKRKIQFENSASGGTLYKQQKYGTSKRQFFDRNRGRVE